MVIIVFISDAVVLSIILSLYYTRYYHFYQQSAYTINSDSCAININTITITNPTILIIINSCHYRRSHLPSPLTTSSPALAVQLEQALKLGGSILTD